MKHILFFIILLSEAWTQLATNDEASALDEFRKGLHDYNNQLGDWNVMDSTPCFSWSHVYCNFDNVVTAISLPYKNFSGTISPALVDLRFLLNLNLEGNELRGNIPPELGNISTLSFINLAQNELTGTIPETLGQLKQLKHLILNNNYLSGEIPSSLASIQGLTNLYVTWTAKILSSNNLSGNIPMPLFQIAKYNYTDNNLNCQNITPYHCNSGYSSTSGLSKNAMIAVYVGSIGGGILIILLIICLVSYYQGAYNGYRRELYFDVCGDDRKISYGQLKRFSWHELQLSTDNFSEKNILGEGGFGKVYIGVLSDDTKIAIKRLMNYHSAGGEATFLREVEMISFAVHHNLIWLIGFCVSPSERLLVHPYMKNLSLAYQLIDKPGEKGLDWPTRKNVAVGAARGLEYLHEHCNPKIIHRDVKAASVLLDDHFEGIVGDFGLAKLVDARQTHVTTLVCGTMGHIAPEYLSTGRSSEGTDVFGFGIMLLELVTGQRAIDFRRLEEDEDVLLLDLVRKFERQQRLDELIDKNLKKSYNVEEVEMVVQVALLCTQTQPEKRPTMIEVVRMLEGEGLGERWQEVRNIEFAKSQDTIKPTQFSLFDDSAYNQKAIELSCAR